MPATYNRFHQARPCARRRGFSLLETSVALGVLGVGLIMVAAVFPVALSQHRMSVDSSRANQMVTKAKGMLYGRLNPDLLWIDPLLQQNESDSGWNMIPFVNIQVGGFNWDPVGAGTYADLMNGAPLGSSPIQLFGTDVLSDRITPLDDRRANELPNRMAWYGFYRQLANGSKSYSAVICKQRRNQNFYMQFLDGSLPLSQRFRDPVRGGRPQRLPMPWRITVSRAPGASVLYSELMSARLSDLVPAGSKLMIQGQGYADFAPVPPVPTGRILTVVGSWFSAALSVTNGIQVVEDISDIPADDVSNAGDNNFSFDIIVFPPAVGSDVSPALEWKVFL